MSSDGTSATAPGGVLSMRSTSSKVRSFQTLAPSLQRNKCFLQHTSCIVLNFRYPVVIRTQASWIKRAIGSWEMGGWMRGLAEGGYGINVARNVLLMQELQVSTRLVAIFPEPM